MKIDWKLLSFAMIISIILVCVSVLILTLTYRIVVIPDLPTGKTSMTIAGAGNTFVVLFLSEIISLGFVCIFVLTLVFYTIIDYSRKRKENNFYMKNFKHDR